MADLGLGRHFSIPIKSYTHEVGPAAHARGYCRARHAQRRTVALPGSRVLSAPAWPQIVTLWYRAPEVLMGQAIYTPSIDVSGGSLPPPPRVLWEWEV